MKHEIKKKSKCSGCGQELILDSDGDCMYCGKRFGG